MDVHKEEATNYDNFYLTYNKVFNTLTDNGVKLTKNKNLNNIGFELNNTSPEISTMENNEVLLIYIFNNMNERKKAGSELFSKRKDFIRLFDNKIVFFEALEAKNALIVVTFSDDYFHKSNSDKQNVFTNLKTIVFDKLNEGKERLYTGNSESWEGEILVKFYSYTVLDENGILIDWDDYGEGSGELRYKGNVDDIDTSVKYIFEGNSSSINSETAALKNKEFYKNIEIGISGAPEDYTIYTVIINWNNKVEVFELKAEGE